MGIVHVMRRLRSEYTAMPGLSLTEAQAQRLCTSKASTTTRALRALVSTGFLTVIDGGRYARTDIMVGPVGTHIRRDAPSLEGASLTR
jgi:hypothetical protein